MKKWQVIFYDDYSDVPYTLNLFNSESDAKKWAESHEYDYEDEVYDTTISDYIFKKIYKYHNPEDGESYNGYEVKKVEETTMNSNLRESEIDKNIQKKLVDIFKKKYGNFSKIDYLVNQWLSKSENWKAAYYLSGTEYKEKVLDALDSIIIDWGSKSIFKDKFKPMENTLQESLRALIQKEIKSVLYENTADFKVGEIYRDGDVEYQITTMPDKFKGKYGAGTMNIWVTNLDTEEQHFMPVSMLKTLKQVYVTPPEGRLKHLKASTSREMHEGPEEMGAYRRLVITSPAFEKMKTEFTKFMGRPEVKSMYPVRFKMIDSPKPNTVVVDVEGDKASVISIKLTDLAKKLDNKVKVLIRKERKLSSK